MTVFGREQLSDEAKDELFGDLFDVPVPEAEAEEPSAPDPAAAEEPTGLQPEESVEAVEEPATDGEEVPESGEAATPEPALDETEPEVIVETDWKKRYDDLRTAENKLLIQERERAAAAEAQLQQALQQRAQPRVTEEQLAQFAARAEEMGLAPEQIGLLAEINMAANPQDDTMVNYLAQEAQQARANAARVLAEQEASILQEFQTDHPDLDGEKQQGVGKFLHDVGAAVFMDQYGNALEQGTYEQKLALVANGQAAFNSWPPDQPLSRDALELAYEAVSNPDLAFILRGNPVLCQTDDGIELAREEASRRARERGVTTLPTRAKTSEEIDAELAEAETLGGTSGAEPVQYESPFTVPKEVYFSK